MRERDLSNVISADLREPAVRVLLAESVRLNGRRGTVALHVVLQSKWPDDIWSTKLPDEL